MCVGGYRLCSSLHHLYASVHTVTVAWFLCLAFFIHNLELCAHNDFKGLSCSHIQNRGRQITERLEV